jgi:hypothetical protein
MSCEKKYLKYKNKYKQLKLSQTGGERHNAAIRKTNNTITFPNGFPNLHANGDYNVIHSYDQESVNDERRLGNLRQLNTWLTTTFLQPSANGPIPGNEPINKAYRIFTSDRRDDLLDIMEWLMR